MHSVLFQNATEKFIPNKNSKSLILKAPKSNVFSTMVCVCVCVCVGLGLGLCLYNYANTAFLQDEFLRNRVAGFIFNVLKIIAK